jgi:hypothetical protein
MMYTPWLKKGLTTLALVGATVAQAQNSPNNPCVWWCPSHRVGGLTSWPEPCPSLLPSNWVNRW